MKNMASCCLVLFCLFSLGFTTTTEGLKKQNHCIHIVSINSPSDDPAQSINNYAFQANAKEASLGRKPGLFRLKTGGFLGIQGTVAIESVDKPGYYLRHKNYKFHLQKAIKSSIFDKDASFYLLKVQTDPPLYAFELYTHPSWFIMHTKKKHNLILGRVKGSEKEVMDSTFSFKTVQCPHKQKGRVQKKTVVVGHGSLMEDQSDDDDLSDIDSTKEHDEGNAIGRTISSAHARTTLKAKSSNVTRNKQAILHEVEQALNATVSNNNSRQLDELEKDIERKVNNLASSLYKENRKALNAGSTNSKGSVRTLGDDVIIKTEDSSIKDHVPRGSFGKALPDVHNSMKLQEAKKPGNNKNVQTSANSVKSYKINSNVVKGSPKLVNDHYDIIARASLGIPEGRKDKLHNQVLESAQDAARKDNMITKSNHSKPPQPKAENTKQLFGDLRGSVHISSGGYPLKKSLTIPQQTMHRQSNLYSNFQKNNSKVMANDTKTNPYQYKPQIKQNGMINAHGRPVVYFTQNCQDVLPTVCGKWAQERYCLVFNELMKRYCRKSCGLCDRIVTTGFSPCDKSCGGGIRLRMIKVNNRQVLQRRACNTHNCPIDGGYTTFSNFSECSATCGKGLRYKHRTCTQPPPQYGGKDCTRLGSPIKTVPCHVVECKVAEGKKKHAPKQGGHVLMEEEDYEHMPEYQVEKLTKGYTVNTGELNVRRISKVICADTKKYNSGILKHIKGNMYEYYNQNGKKKIVRLKGRHSKLRHHNHHVYHKGRQVANLRCSPSKFLKYRQVESNSPLNKSSFRKRSGEFGEDNPYKMYEDGKVIYDKYGMPSGTTEEVVKSLDSPYKIILHHNKNHQLVVSEECLESDSSVNPDEGETKSFQKPAQGFYGYNYEDPNQSYGTPSLLAQSALGNEVTQAMGSIGRAIDDDTNVLTISSLLQKEEPKATLSEELAAENEEAFKERRYEENVAQKSTKQYGFS